MNDLKSSMRILVTGATGFIGKTVLASLRALSHDVIGTSLKKSLRDQGVFQLDISAKCQVNKFSKAHAPVDVMIHAAASRDKDQWSESIITSNCLGTHNILWLAAEWNVSRFIYISGVNVVGRPETIPITEEHPTRPISTYHCSKLFGEQLSELFAEVFKVFILRVSAPVGVGIDESRFIATCIKNAMANKPIYLLGKGGRRQNYVDVRDIASAVKLCLNAKNGGIYNVGGDRAISNLKVAQASIDLSGSKSNIQLLDRDDSEEYMDWSLSLTKSRALLGYEPSYSIWSSLITMIEFYRLMQEDL